MKIFNIPAWPTGADLPNDGFLSANGLLLTTYGRANVNTKDALTQHTKTIECLQEQVTRQERELSELRSLLYNSLYIDALTGIKNRVYYAHHIETTWNTCQRSGKPISIIVIDVDFFKKANTLYGYDQANEILAEVARVLTDAKTRPGDIYARFGGDEFVVALYDTDTDGARYVASELCDRVYNANIYHAGGIEQIATISAGTATCDPSHQDYSDIDPGVLFKRACDALVQAKNNGKSQAFHYSDLPTQQSQAA